MDDGIIVWVLLEILLVAIVGICILARRLNDASKKVSFYKTQLKYTDNSIEQLIKEINFLQNQLADITEENIKLVTDLEHCNQKSS